LRRPCWRMKRNNFLSVQEEGRSYFTLGKQWIHHGFFR
jgi:hypothetical protein